MVGLHQPDAQFVSHNEHDAEQTIDGPVVAIVGDVFATAADAEAVFDYYDARLPELGYERDQASPYQIKTTTEEEVRVWRDGNVVVRLAIFAEEDPQVPPLPAGMAEGTLFELALIGTPPDRNANSP